MLRSVAAVLGLAVAYYAAGRLSLALQYEGPVAVLWLPSGLGAAVLYRAGLRWWPGLLIGDLALLDPSHPPATALGITAGNLLAILAVATVLRSLLGPRAALDRLQQVGGVLVAIACGATITATVAVLCVHAGGVVAGSELPEFWRSWLLAEACGSLVAIPLALAWAHPRPPGAPRHARWEGPLILVALVALSVTSVSVAFPLAYLVFPALVWAALRFGQRGATLAVAVTATVTVAMTAADLGAFVEHSLGDLPLSTQLYIAVAALTALCLAAIDSERRHAQREVAASRARIAAAGAHERRVLELELHDTAQSRLFALLIRLGLLREHIPREWPDVVETLDELIQQAEALGDDLHAVAERISPPLLASAGVADALAVECARRSARVQIAADDIRPSTPEAELAVYSCCLEAIRSATDHGGRDAPVIVRLRHHDGVLAFSVEGDGRGAAGPALVGLRDRVESVGGRVALLRDRPTAVAGTVPWPPRDAGYGPGPQTGRVPEEVGRAGFEPARDGL